MRRGEWRGTIRLLAVATAVALGACAPSVERPDVRLDGISVGGLGLEGGTLRVRLMVANPNAFALRASQLHYQLQLADSVARNRVWADVAEGDYSQDIEVGARDSAAVEIPVRFQYRDLSSAVRSVLARGTFDYRVAGTVQLREPLSRRIPFRKTGTVEVFH